MKYLHLVASNLKRRKARTVLTFLSIAVAFLLFGYLAAIRLAFNAGVEVAGVDRLAVRHKYSIIQMLPISYKARIERVPGVTAVTHASWFGGIYREPKNFFPQFPVEPRAYLDMYPEILLPEEEKQAWIATRTGAVAGRKTADRFGWKVGDRIPIQGTVWALMDGSPTWEFDLKGIYDGRDKGTDTTTLLFQYDYFDEARRFAKGMIGWYLVRLADPSQSTEVARRIDEEFANSSYETKASTEKAFIQAFAKQVGNIGAIMVAVLSAVFFTILLVAGNTMAQSVRERTGELAVLKAVGFTDRKVLGLVLAESMLLSVAGGACGLFTSWWLIRLGDPTQGALPVFYIPPRDMAVGASLMALLGLAAGIIPALQAGRLRISDAMRRM